MALLYMPEGEAIAVRNALGDRYEAVGIQFDEWRPDDFSFAVIGSCGSRRHALLDPLSESIKGTPSIVLVADARDVPPDRDWLSVEDLHRLPYIIQREVRLRETELLLRDAMRRNAEMMENAHEGLWITDANGVTTFVNRKMALLLEANAPDIIGRSAFDFVDPEWLSVADANMERRRLGVTETHDIRLRRAGGSTFYATISSKPIYDQTGDFAGTSNLVLDITARREVEEELIRRETELSIAHELARLGSWEWDFQSNRLHGSRELFRLTGMGDRTGALDLEEWLTIVAVDEVDALRDKMRRAVAERSEFEHEFQLRGSDRILHARGRVIADSESAPRRMIGMAQDVTQIRRDAEELARSEQRYRALVDQATDIIFSLDAEQRITSLNPAFESTTGWKVSDWIGRPLSDCLAPTSPSGGRADFEAMLSGDGSPHDFELRTAKGGMVTIEMTVQPLAGNEAGTIGIARNITRRKETERALEQEKRLSSLGHLAASVAHEFNNVLMSIMPFAELLKRRAPDDERTAMASQHIFRAIRRGRQISHEILRFARPAPLTLTSIGVDEWLKGFAPEATALVGVKYKIVSHASGTELYMRADRGSLNRVITNLVVNARDAMPDGGTIAISAAPATRVPGFVAISVSDHGSGISDQHLGRIFDPLFTTKQGGVGLGLSIVHSEATQMGGLVRVESREGEGSTFTVLLPIAERPSEPAAAPRSDEGAPRRILLVEDDEAIGEGLRSLLGDEGYDVCLVTRGGEAKGAVEEFGPDVVVLDVNLPDMSGLEVLQQLRAKHPNLQVILSTGHADANALESIQRMNVPALMKPYEIDDLIALLAQMEARDMS